LRKFTITILLVVVTGMFASALAPAADDSRVKDATRQVETGARQIGRGEIGTGVEETAKGIGRTVVEGAKFAGDKLEESGKAAEPEAKSAWRHVRDGAVDFGHGVRDFFTRLFSN
jgi:hypothetical protein